jgi:hypothetical protein
VVYYILDRSLTELQIIQVQNALWEWQSVTCTVFKPLTASTDPTLAMYPLNILNPYPDDNILYCSSTIGYISYDQRTVGISSLCSYGNVVHELGHSLGLLHEQCRNDPIDDSLFAGPLTLAEHYAPIEEDGLYSSIGPRTVYDLESIMQCNGHQTLTNGEVVQIMRPLPPNQDVPIGQRRRNTVFDAAAVNYRQSCSEFPFFS